MCCSLFQVFETVALSAYRLEATAARQDEGADMPYAYWHLCHSAAKTGVTDVLPAGFDLRELFASFAS